MLGIVTAGTPFLASLTAPSVGLISGSIVVTRSKMTVLGQNVALKSDIRKTLVAQCSAVAYINPPYLNGTLKFDKIKEIKLSKKTKLGKYPVVLEGSVTATFKKQVQAINPADGTPDRAPFYTFTFKLTPRPRKASSR